MQKKQHPASVCLKIFKKEHVNVHESRPSCVLWLFMDTLWCFEYFALVLMFVSPVSLFPKLHSLFFPSFVRLSSRSFLFLSTLLLSPHRSSSFSLFSPNFPVMQRKRMKAPLSTRNTRRWNAIGKSCFVRNVIGMHVCVHACVCVTMKKSARRMASTTSDTSDTSSKQQHAQRKENYNKSKRPVSSVDHCHPYRRY